MIINTFFTYVFWKRNNSWIFEQSSTYFGNRCQLMYFSKCSTLCNDNSMNFSRDYNKLIGEGIFSPENFFISNFKLKKLSNILFCGRGKINGIALT